MTCSVYNSCQQLSKQLCKITKDLNQILCDIHSTKRPLKSTHRTSKLAKTLQQRDGAISDWYLRPVHLSSTAPLLSKDPAPLKSIETASSNKYIPGSVGCIIADIRKDIEKQNLAQKSEKSEKRRMDLCCDCKLNKVFPTQVTDDVDAHLEDYIDEIDMENLNTYENDMADKIMETVNSRLSDPNDKVMTPYHAKLAQLRMEELLLEEERLLELKRIQELIRTRRPRKYWYMLRSKEFTEELMRNTEMVRNGQYQEEIDRYRTELIKASLKTGKLFCKPII